MYFISIVFKNLFQRRLRTFFTILGIGAAVAAFIALVGLARGYESAWQTALEHRNTHLFASRKGVVDILSGTIDADAGRKMALIDGIKRASGERLDLFSLDTGEMIIVAGWPNNSFLWESILLKQGHLPTPGSTNEVILGPLAASALKIKPGETFTMHGRTFTLVGISEPGSTMQNNAMIVALESLDEINSTQGELTTMNFQLDQPEDERAVLDTILRLEEAFPDYTFTRTSALAENNKVLQMFKTMAWGTSMIAIFICLVVIVNTLLMAVMERTREIGVLVAIGWSPARILSLIALEGLLLSAAGAFSGAVIGIYGLITLADLPQMKSFIQPGVDFRLVCEIIIMALVIGFLGSAYPAWRAIRLRPALALKHR